MGANPPTILIVDDTPENLSVLGELLQPAYRVRAANSGRRGDCMMRAERAKVR